MFRRSLAIAIVFAFVSPIFSQVSDKKDPKEQAAELRKQAVAFLRETMSDVANMRTLENRISFSAELAGLMWFNDEREARAMFATAIGDFRELVARLDTQMNALPEADGDGDMIMSRALFGDDTGRAKVEMKYRVAMAVRQQIASSIAEHDADLALGFYYDTASTNPKIANSYGGRDSHFEFGLLQQIAENNAAKAVQHGIKTLDKGLQYQHVELLRKIYEKDAERGIEFGAALLGKVDSKKLSPADLYTVSSLLEFGTSNFDAVQDKPGKKPVYTQSDLRSLAETLAKTVLEREGGEEMAQYASKIERFLPGRAAQIRAKFRNTSNRNSNSNSSRLMTYGSTNTYAYPTNSVANANYYGNSAQPPPDAKQAAEEKLMTDVAKIGKSELPKEERERVIGQARKILLQTKGRDKQIAGLSMLAAQVAKAGDKELATEIMRDAQALVNPNPKHFQDFMYTWMLAAGYAEADPDKAFPILEDAIGRANDLIHAFVRVGEFIDVTEEMISDGEVQVGAFGGGMIRGLSKELGVAETTIGTLVKADFAKTKALTNRFDRPEVRLLAKMLVLRAVLGKTAEMKTPGALTVIN